MPAIKYHEAHFANAVGFSSDSSDANGRGQHCTDSRDREVGGISSEDFPSQAQSAFVHNAIVRPLSRGEVTCHRSWTFPLVSQDLKSPQDVRDSGMYVSTVLR